jgi:pimeloyl-ACP methyl ester carboxylesterase
MGFDIRYARSGDVSIAYTVTGAGPDLMLIPGFVSHIDSGAIPKADEFSEKLARFARVIAFDKRGHGLSDRGVGITSLEDYVSDVRAVMDATGSTNAALLGVSEGGATASLFAAMHPDRVRALIVFGGFARLAAAPDYPIGLPPESFESAADYVSERWGSGVGLSMWAPSVRDDPEMREQWARFQRMAASPADVRATFRSYASFDVRDILPAISAPTVVMHREGDVAVPVAVGRYIADHIDGARFVELPGADHFIFTGDTDAVVGEIEEVVTGTRHAPVATRRLATVLFTDIVSSTETAAGLGDAAWREVLIRHDAMIRRALDRFGGRAVKTTGDGFLALFDGPSAAIKCGEAIKGGASGFGIRIRAGIHAGEVELIGDDIGGIGVHIAKRVADLAPADETWVSSTVPGLAVGSGIRFDERGTHTLKGVPGDWLLYAAAA